MIFDWPRFARERQVLRSAAATTDFRGFSTNPRAAAALTLWFLRLEVLPQFSWALDQL